MSAMAANDDNSGDTPVAKAPRKPKRRPDKVSATTMDTGADPCAPSVMDTDTAQQSPPEEDGRKMSVLMRTSQCLQFKALLE